MLLLLPHASMIDRCCYSTRHKPRPLHRPFIKRGKRTEGWIHTKLAPFCIKRKQRNEDGVSALSSQQMIRSSVRGKRVYLTVCGNEIAPILRMIMRGGKEQRIERISIEHRHRQAESSWKGEKAINQPARRLGELRPRVCREESGRLSACRGKGLAGWPPFRCLSHRAQGDKPSCKLQPHGEGPNQSQEAGEIRRAEGMQGRKEAG
jgi:hypothetical protein